MRFHTTEVIMRTTFKRIQPSHVLGTLLLSCAAAAAWAECCGTDPGRMTGGGSIICQGAAYRHTFGYELHCKRPGMPVSEPNNLEVNLSTGEHFHLTSLNTSACTGPDATTPDANFNTIYGSGPGRLNGEPAWIWFNFVDKAEPGAGVDYAAFTIQTSAGTLLQCKNVLEGGNNQAHRATGNKP
jgi:hypothetical protein